MRLVIAAAVALACARPARAGDDTSLAQARRDVESSDYMAARTDLVSALDAGTADPDELAEIYKLTGIDEAALGNTSDATAAFARWLVLDPHAALPEGTSPKITKPFDAAKKTRPQPLELKPETRSDPPHLTLVVEHDTFKLVVRARAYVSVDGKPERKLEAAGASRIEVDLPPGRRLDIRVEALDAHGNRVATVGSRDVPIVITNDAQPPDLGHANPSGPGTSGTLSLTTGSRTPDAGSRSGRPIYLSYWLWGGAAVALAAGGSYFGLQARDAADQLRQLNADSQQHSFSEAQSVQSRGQRDALLCNIGLISAGAFAVAAGILFVTAPHHHAESHVAAVPTTGGGAVVFGGSF